MIPFPPTRLVKISTPYMKGGVLYEDFTRGFGQDDPDLLVHMTKRCSLLSVIRRRAHSRASGSPQNVTGLRSNRRRQ
jgi:hypothetical protein